jgi:UDP-glucose 4-epimerase
MLKMKKVLVTGASGLLGRVVCQQLLDQSASVTAISHISPLPETNSIRSIPIDLSSNWSTEQLPLEINTIIHLAQSRKFRDFPNNALDVFNVNVSSTAKLLDYAMMSGVSQFIFASSGGVYGNGSHAFNENSSVVEPGQLNFYLGSKTSGEIFVQSYSSVFQVIVIRPFFIYGFGQNRSMLIPRLFDSIGLGRPIKLQDQDGIRINPVHVEDASAAILAAMDTTESATYNIAGPDVLSIRQIADSMSQYLGKASIYEYDSGMAHDLIADISLMRSKLHDPKRQLFNYFPDIQAQVDL